MGLSNKILPHYTYQDYICWEGRWELIEGHPFAMSPLPVPKHQQVAGNLLYEFKSELKKICTGCKAYLPLDYKVADDTVLQPELLIICQEIHKKYIDFPPVLVVEILSPSTVLKDRNTKFEIYQSEKVKYYMIVDPQSESLRFMSCLTTNTNYS
jgi:Uma2 family endonuclease